MGPNGLKTLRMVTGVVVEEIEPIHRALVGEFCKAASNPSPTAAPDVPGPRIGVPS
jgi:hypothetical protein